MRKYINSSKIIIGNFNTALLSPDRSTRLKQAQYGNALEAEMSEWGFVYVCA